MRRAGAILLFCALNAFGLSESTLLTLRAKAEGWTYNANHPAFSTGLISKQYRDVSRSSSYESLKDADIEIPEEYDLRGKIGEIRSQGGCGSCWAFSIIAMLRDAVMLKGEKDPGFVSEQYLVDCAADMYGCGGGMPSAAKWVTVPHGAPGLSDYPYHASNGRCQSGKTVVAQALEWHYVGSEGKTASIEDIQKTILTYGPVSVTVAVDNAFAGYSGGVFHGRSRSINHMTDIVGWSKKGGYWIMRNSWGKEWGIEGFGYIAYGANSIADETIFVKVKEAPPVPVIREFGMDARNLSIKVTLSSSNKVKSEDAKVVLQPFLNALDRR